MTVKGIEMRRIKQLLSVCPKNGPRRDCCQSPWTCLRSHECRLDCLLAPRGAHCVWARERGAFKRPPVRSAQAHVPRNIRTKLERSATILLPNSVARPGTDQNSMGRLSQIL